MHVGDGVNLSKCNMLVSMNREITLIGEYRGFTRTLGGWVRRSFAAAVTVNMSFEKFGRPHALLSFCVLTFFLSPKLSTTTHSPTMPKKGCSYERVRGRCLSKKAYQSRHSPKKTRGCKYGRNTKSTQCYSKKAFQSKMRSLRKKSAAHRILAALRRRSRSRK